VYFQNESRLEFSCLPTESIQCVKHIIWSTFLPELQHQQKQPQDGFDFDLYISPPKRILKDNVTLQEEQLVPAAKLFVSWKDGKSPSTLLSGDIGNNSSISFIQPQYFQPKHTPFSNRSSAKNVGGVGGSSSFPESKPVAEDNEQESKSQDSNKNNNTKKVASTSNKEEELMMKMMGKKGGLFGGKGRTLGASTASSSSSDKKGTGGKPKWLKI
jgi:hypothetical protein